MNAAAAKRVWSAVRRVYPRCGMISQAVAFNMFLAFFPMLLVVLGILSSYVNTRAALPDVVEGLYAVVPLTVFGLPLRKWTMQEFGRSRLVSGFESVMFPAIAMVLAIVVLAVIYSVAHPVTRGWREVLPGAAAATLAWWAVNSLFGIYVRRMQYSQVYGGLAAAIGLMVWMELSAVIVFLGAAWNAEAAARESEKREAR